MIQSPEIQRVYELSAALCCVADDYQAFRERLHADSDPTSDQASASARRVIELIGDALLFELSALDTSAKRVGHPFPKDAAAVLGRYSIEADD